MAIPFGGPVRSGLAAGTPHVVAGEFTGDGVLDVLTVNPELQIVSVRPGNGDGSFRQAINTSAPVGWFAAVGDMNGDRQLDAVYMHYFSTSMAVSLGRGDGTFAPAIVTQMPNNDGQPYPGQIVLTDLDVDGNLDVVLPSNRLQVVVARGLGDGSFALPVSTSRVVSR